MRILSLDVGERRTGVAMSDDSMSMAFPLITITGKARDAVIERVLALAAEHGVSEIVVGMPVSLSGVKGFQAERVMRFIEALAGHTSIPVVTVDERFSSSEAEALLRQMGIEPSRNKGKVDSAAAALVLQSYLDYRRKSSGTSHSGGPE